jgi:adenosylcobinamide-phosphate synthase
MTHAALVAAGALALDLAAGEPPNVLHPVVWIGALQGALRKRAPTGKWAAFTWGAGMALLGPALFGGGAWALARALAGWPLVQLAVEIYLLKSAFAVRALAEAGGAVGRALAAGDLEAARAGLRALVSRDARALSEPLVAAAAIESIAENSSDSVVAPLCAFLVGGVPGALAYRAINTLDAMIGYHGETEWLGKLAARLDDFVNWIPARLTAALIVVAAAIVGESARGAIAIWLRDGGATESPNAGRPMAAMAGALSVELEKLGCYRLGGGGRLPGARDVERALAVFAGACSLAAAGVVLAA